MKGWFMEKILIVTEKPDAAKNFAKALDGKTGVYGDKQFAIINLYGHVLTSGKPHEVALPQYSETVGLFSKIDAIPWSPSYFDFKKKQVSESLGDLGTRLMATIRKYLDAGYIPCIATDTDVSGEGDLLGLEVFEFLNYKGRMYRVRQVDESAKSIRKAMDKMTDITYDDPAYRKAFSRSNMDFLTQQLTRYVTMRLQELGYDLPGPVPFGRLQSLILVLIAEQNDAIANYKPSSVFESRYRLDNLVLSNPDMVQFKTKEEWRAEGLPFEAKVKEVRQVPGKTIPPKALTFSKLAGIVSKQGIKAKRMKDLFQKMYEDSILSYPRTDDNYISPEQFNEMLPLVDNILDIIGMPTAPFTHRTARPTHVKEGTAHGALRPGLVLPQSLEYLDATYGTGAGTIYKVVAQRFLMMFLEDTEWIRHEYETVGTTPVFSGSVKVITKQGVTDPEEEDSTDVVTLLPDLSKMAELYPHEIKSKRPETPTVNWLMNQLDKLDVGTGATRVSTFANISGESAKYPVNDGKSLTLRTLGQIGALSARGTIIGSADGTRKIQALADVVKDGGSYDEAYEVFTQIIAADIATIDKLIETLAYELDELGVPKKKPKLYAIGQWNGEEVRFNRVYGGHEFTDDEVNTLLSGGEVAIEIQTKDGKPAKVKGGLAEQEYNGNIFIGFKGAFVREGYVDGEWNGQQISFKGSYMDHVFTPAEVDILLSGGTVPIRVTDKSGKQVDVTGKLEVQEYQGRKFVGYKAVFPPRQGYVSGKWNGQDISFKGSYMDHVFTTEEVQALLAGKEITINATGKDGKIMTVTGKLEVQEYQGRKFVGFKGRFPQREGYASGKWNGKDVSFKAEFMQHKFTDDEIKRLLAGEKIMFKGMSKAGKEMVVGGGLALQSYQGRSFVGFKAEFDNKQGAGDSFL